ncbi:uncharacterized protein FFFS_15795 [Fusarium fujikuroi]|nr:uncharacterized protein FFFS_15795 [Fusarium fujikuroi]
MVVSADESSRYCICFPKNIEGFGQLNSCKTCHLSIPDEKAIYMAFKDIEAVRHIGTMGLRSKKPNVKQIIQEQMKRPAVRELSRRYGMEAVVSTIQTLSESMAFTSHHAAMRRFSSLDRDMPTAYCDEDKPPEKSGAYCEIIAEATKEKTDWTPEEATNPDSCNWPCEPDVEENDGLVATKPQPEATECKPCTDGDINPSPNNTPTSDAPTEGEKELRLADPE